MKNDDKYISPNQDEDKDLSKYLVDNFVDYNTDVGSKSEIDFKVADDATLQKMSAEQLKTLSNAMHSALESTKNDGGMYKVASVFAGQNQQMPYPTPFVTLSDTKMPRSTSDIFKWCKYYYMFDALISGAINALSTFPITEVYLEDIAIHNESQKNKELQNSDTKANEKQEESEQLRFYKKVLFNDLDLYTMLIGIGIDYFLYGNCFVFGEMKQDEVTGKIKWKHCIRLDPSKVIIDYNPVTQEKNYRWMVPEKVAKIVKDRKPKEEYDKIPQVIKDAVAKKKTILLNKNNIYHFARIADSSGDNMIWGIPIIANVMKLLMYRTILRQAQEAIAREHIVPMRIFYLQKQDSYNPAADWNAVAQNLSMEIQKSVRDPNYKVVSPVPIGMQNVGGDGRALMLTAEIEQIQSEILAGMNVPRDFLFGGISYSGTSISLKILENQFITYRLRLRDFVQNFLIKKLAQENREWLNESDDDKLVQVKMVDMKMQDDVQQKQIIIDLNRSGKVSDEYMWKSLGLDPDNIKSSLQSEAIARINDNKEVQLAQVAADMEVQKAQIQAQLELQQFQQSLGINNQDPNAQQQADQGQDPNAQQQMSQDQGANMQQQPSQNPNEQQEPEQQAAEQNIMDVVQQLAQIPKKQRVAFINTLPQNVQQQVYAMLQELEAQKQSQQGVDMRPLPQQKPPRRNSLKS